MGGLSHYYGIKLWAAVILLFSSSGLAAISSQGFKEQVKENLLKKLGFSERPSIIPQNEINSQEKEFMLDLYHKELRQLHANAGESTSGTLLYNFHPICRAEPTESGSHLEMEFDVAEKISNPENIISANLRVRLGDAMGTRAQSEKLSINVYRRRVAQSHRQDGGAPRRHLLDSKDVFGSDASSWVDFAVGEAVHHWLRRTDSNVGIDVEILDENGKEIDWPKTDCKHDNFTTSAKLLVLAKKTVRTKRSEDGKIIQNNCRSNSLGCCRVPTNIKFIDLGWEDWILTPKGFKTGYCQGTCSNVENPFEYGSGKGGTFFWQRIEEVSANSEDRCCGPSQTSPLLILFIHLDGTIEMARIRGFLVDGCGCRK